MVVHRESHRHVAILRLDRPERRNALDTATVEQLIGHLDSPGDDTAFVLCGQGTVFCSGYDLKSDETATFADRVLALFARLRSIPVPVVCAVHGQAIGMGALLALSCDLRVGGPDAEFSVPATRLGLAMRSEFVDVMVEALGRSMTRRLLLGDESVRGEELLYAGMVDRRAWDCVPRAIEWAHHLGSLSTVAYAAHKAAIRTSSV